MVKWFKLAANPILQTSANQTLVIFA